MNQSHERQVIIGAKIDTVSYYVPASIVAWGLFTNRH